MKDLCIQIHPDRVAGLDMKAVRSRCEAVAGNPLVSRFAINEGTDNGRYVNVMFETADTSALWKLLWRDVCGDPVFGEPLRLASMAMCHGEHGWDDYLLLHHYDPAQPLDRLERA